MKLIYIFAILFAVYKYQIKLQEYYEFTGYRLWTFISLRVYDRKEVFANLSSQIWIVRIDEFVIARILQVSNFLLSHPAEIIYGYVDFTNLWLHGCYKFSSVCNYTRFTSLCSRGFYKFANS